MGGQTLKIVSLIVAKFILFHPVVQSASYQVAMLNVDKFIAFVEEEGVLCGMSEVRPIKIKMTSPEHEKKF